MRHGARMLRPAYVKRKRQPLSRSRHPPRATHDRSNAPLHTWTSWTWQTEPTCLAPRVAASSLALFVESASKVAATRSS
jgi:hypothetical protein